MGGRKFSEKTKEYNTELQSKIGIATIVISQHILLWASLYVLAVSIYVVAETTADDSILTATILMITAVRKQKRTCLAETY